MRGENCHGWGMGVQRNRDCANLFSLQVFGGSTRLQKVAWNAEVVQSVLFQVAVNVKRG